MKKARALFAGCVVLLLVIGAGIGLGKYQYAHGGSIEYSVGAVAAELKSGAGSRSSEFLAEARLRAQFEAECGALLGKSIEQIKAVAAFSEPGRDIADLPFSVGFDPDAFASYSQSGRQNLLHQVASDAHTEAEATISEGATSIIAAIQRSIRDSNYSITGSDTARTLQLELDRGRLDLRVSQKPDRSWSAEAISGSSIREYCPVKETSGGSPGKKRYKLSTTGFTITAIGTLGAVSEWAIQRNARAFPILFQVEGERANYSIDSSGNIEFSGADK